MVDDGKHALYEQFARLGKALGSPVRLVLLDLLGQAERGVDELAEAAGVSVANTSAQLQALRRVGLVTTRREGNRVYYRLASAEVGPLLGTLTRVAEQHSAEAERAAHSYLGDLTTVEPIGAEELRSRVENGRALVVDVRPEVEYAAGHVPAARCIPLDELRARLDELPEEVEIIAYCRGPYCVYAPEAVRLLQRHGRAARLLRGGTDEWRRAGLAVATTALERNEPT